MTGLVVSAFEGTVVTTAMPAVARDLGGLDLYPWVFAAYLVASTLAVPLFGKLADRVGRRPVFTAGMALFLLGSALCGLATTMPALIAFRVVQGLGVGAIGPTGTTISADLYTLEERARVQGLFTGAWGLANIAGPLIGATIVAHLSWRWVFLVNLPVGLIAVALLWVSYTDPPARAARGPLDLTGAGLAAVAIGALLLAVEHGGGISTAGHLLAAVVACAAGGAVVLQQRAAQDPVLPLAQLRDPAVRAGAVGSLFAGALLYVPSAYVPLWIAHETHGGLLVAGAALIPLLVGWSVGSTAGVAVMVRFGMRASAVGGLLLAALGASALAAAAAMHAERVWVLAALGTLGLGLGPAANACLLGPQSRVGWHSRGAVTSLVHAARALGGSVAVAAVAAAHSGAGRFAALAGATWVGVALIAWLTPRDAGRVRRG